jgi:hypothetical protein
MTIEELKKFAAVALEHAVQILVDTGDLPHMLQLVRRSGVIEIIVSLPDITNSEQNKYGLSQMLRARMAEHGDVEAVIMVSDVFWAYFTTEQEKIKRAFRLTVEQAAGAGLCERLEAVMVTLESPILYQMAKQKYIRGADKRTITLDGEPEVVDDTGSTPDGIAQFTGRFTNLFRHDEAARA